MLISSSETSRTFPAFPRLLADIGGTNARFGWQASPGLEISRIRVLPVSDYADLREAIEGYLTLEGLPRPLAAALGMANPVTGDSVAMTNHHWRFSVQRLREQLGLQRLMVLNDFTALALALPTLDASHLHAVGLGCEPSQRSAIALIGPGTGLGVSGLLPVPGSTNWAPIVGEGGHVSLTPATQEEWAVVEFLRPRHGGHVSAERVLCGQGLLDIAEALSAVRGLAPPKGVSPAQVLEQGLNDHSSLSKEVLDLFCAWLGSVAGDLALTLGARGGVYIGGGIVPRMRQFFMASSFRTRFESKGRFQAYLRDVPVWLIDAPVSPALRGAAVALSLND